MTSLNQISRALGATIFGALLTGTNVPSAFAVPYERIKAIDVNGNGIIDVGSEFFELTRLRDALLPEQRVAYEEHLVEPSPAGLLVSEFDSSDLEANLRQQCAFQQHFFLQDSVSDVSLAHASFVKKTKNGASVSMTWDQNTHVSSWQLNGVAAILGPGSNKCLLPPPDERVPGAAWTGFSYAPYVEFNGSGNSRNNTNSSLVFGIKNEFNILDGLFDFQEFSINPYYQTDFDFDTEIFGISGEWKPYVLDWHLNAYRTENDFTAWWSIIGIADFRTVKNAGNTGLVGSEDYGWLGAKIGAQASYSRLFANANLSAFSDVLSDDSAIMFDASTGVYLSEDKRTSLTLTYQNGTQYKTNLDVEDITLKLNVAF